MCIEEAIVDSLLGTRHATVRKTKALPSRVYETVGAQGRSRQCQCHMKQGPGSEEHLDMNIRDDCVKEVTSEPRHTEWIGAGIPSNSRT